MEFLKQLTFTINSKMMELEFGEYATAFEDFDKNTLENLKLLLETGEVIGDTKQWFGTIW